MGTVLTIPIQKGRTVKEPYQLVVFNPIPGVSMTCMEMLQNGALIGFPKNMSLQRRILKVPKKEPIRSFVEEAGVCMHIWQEALSAIVICLILPTVVLVFDWFY